MRGKELFLPDFCDIRSVFAVVVVGQLLAFVLVLAAPRAQFWQALSLTSLFVQWIGLASAATLCLLRPWLARAGNALAAALSYAVILLITAVVSGLGARLLNLDGSDQVGFVARSLAIGAIAGAVVLRYLYVVHEWKRRLSSEAAARIDALQARIRPHFLFNSLNTIASMIPLEPQRAEESVEDLSDLFRASLAESRRLQPLSQELALCRGYLRMEELRLGQRLRIDWRLDGVPEDALIPPLTLQPLLENAVYHGIEPRLAGGTLLIEGRRDGELLTLRLRNPRPATPAVRRGAGMAQQNIRERLALAFGKKAELIVREVGEDYEVELTLPYRTQMEAT